MNDVVEEENGPDEDHLPKDHQIITSVQRDDKKAGADKLSKMAAQTFARTINGQEMNQEMEGVQRWNGPAAGFLTKTGQGGKIGSLFLTTVEVTSWSGYVDAYERHNSNHMMELQIFNLHLRRDHGYGMQKKYPKWKGLSYL
ncbi:uncharacterized protein MELLADRAFT_104001 [Melampsora larici-populina 98AG31]|uniref:Uncharacterized protein n=1 Tax=Melampsora larici-populina (strain 98AG31 / pathotype 3-4-7) TaxID=747676 RepID=F4RD84_MELLP|nr:uncharacterized protein MELLADRAFT_104001 [Melampsora larici-populina 98AG31]EGG09653.1 hypothetical protein MELLADRAFT_104001 [Melampsora larici-populina 98AG31]